MDTTQWDMHNTTLDKRRQGVENARLVKGGKGKRERRARTLRVYCSALQSCWIFSTRFDPRLAFRSLINNKAPGQKCVVNCTLRQKPRIHPSSTPRRPPLENRPVLFPPPVPEYVPTEVSPNLIPLSTLSASFPAVLSPPLLARAFVRLITRV